MSAGVDVTDVAPVVSKPETHVYNAAYASVPNWDVGHPQRAFVALAEAGFVRGNVLDVGCGTGELSLYLARRGHQVLGIDLAPLAIRQARAKARWRRIDAQFLVWDALELEALVDAGFRFQTVVDCAMFHVLGDRQRDRFVEGLGAVLPPGGAYFVLGDVRTDERSIYGISPAELERRFRPEAGWRVEFVERTVFERRYSRNPAYVAGIHRTASVSSARRTTGVRR